ncbi:MAG: MBL fold metallo-hydrolase [Clostridia bacterium]|nr:MBL fold metallo-hydrolase [Clostridia bacterium]
MNIICAPTGPLSTNTYILYNEEGSAENRADCVVIDPASSRKVMSILDGHGLRCTHILLTHGHFDHIMGVAELKARENALVYIHEADAACVTGTSGGSLAFMAGALVKHCEVDRRLTDNESFTAAGMDFKVIHTPGHTPGGVCYIMEKERIIFSGDTLFELSVGRTDLAGGSDSELYESIAYRLFPLHGDYRVLTGHGGETTLEFERQHNPYMKKGGMY